MKSLCKLVALPLLTLSQLANSPLAFAEYSAIYEQEWAVDNKGRGQKFETLFEPQWNTSLTDNLDMTFIGRVRFDGLDKLGPDDDRGDNYGEANGPVLTSEHGDISIREWFFDTEVAGSYWRIGKQQVVWGQADGLKVLDVVNPQSYREFILDDFEDSRIPLWMANIELPIGDENSLQLLWIPDLSYNEFAVDGSVYQLTTPLLAPQVSALQAQGITFGGYRHNKPSSPIKDSDLGLRYSMFYHGWDLIFNYFYHYLDSPVNYQRIEQNQVYIEAKYQRSHLLGATASKAFGDFTLRTEVGYSSDSYHLLKPTAAAYARQQGIHNSADISSVIGLDWQGLTDAMISVQWFQSYLLDDEPGLIRGQNDHTLSFMYTQTFENETWEFETLVLHGLELDDGSVQTKLSYMLESNIKLYLGADIFYGNEAGLLGQFKDTDRFTIGFEWGF
ncbi:DUF1302 family protein [Thalassomonas sp. RHCl1]|uniref:DUF1302 family protein n=1 Tax=Thalassomonas sp. RHCl1 TaxID=2995320 RepID=UPI00248B12A1|nr:DUF1302 family protein [Thalassomonas sp. RHCl1]